MKPVDTLISGVSEETRAGSNPVIRTIVETAGLSRFSFSRPEHRPGIESLVPLQFTVPFHIIFHIIKLVQFKTKGKIYV